MSKRIGNIKRLLVAMGISFLSVCTLNQMADAALLGKVEHYRDNLENKVRYELSLEETDDTYQLEGIYCGGEKLTPKAGSVSGNKVNSVVVEVPSSATELVVKNTNPETPDSINISLSELNENIRDNQAPEINWKYKNVEGNYVQFEAQDNVVIDRILDADRNDRVIIQEKDKENVVTAKYKLKDTEEKVFYVVDRLGNETAVNIATGVVVEYTLAAKDVQGNTVVLNIKLPENTALQSITTVEGENIKDAKTEGEKEIANAGKEATDPDYYNGPIIDKRARSGEDENLVAIYTNVPDGTTFVNVNYKAVENDQPVGEMITIPVELDLDLDGPVLVKRDVSGDGAITEANDGVIRAYKNAAGNKAIVEVKDMVSGITRIAAATGTTDEAESEAANAAFDIQGLPTSIVQLMELPQGATHIRVHDGIGNVQEISIEDDVAEIATNEAAGVTLGLVRVGDAVHATYRSSKAGLEKFVKAKDAVAAIAKEVAETGGTKESHGDKEYFQNNSVHFETIQTTAAIEANYPVTEQSAVISGVQLQGVPEYVAVDVFGNTALKSLNNVLFNANDDEHYIYVDYQNNSTTTAIAVKVHDLRRVKKITATIGDTEKTLETFEIGDTPSTTGTGLQDVDRVYEIEDGVVSKVTVHHWNDPDVTQNVVTIGDNNKVTAANRANLKYGDNLPVIKITRVAETTDKFNAEIRYGIKRIDYSDDTVLEFYDEIPKKVEVQAPSGDNAYVKITDALGYTYLLNADVNNQVIATYGGE